jgi:hypothetical protein
LKTTTALQPLRDALWSACASAPLSGVRVTSELSLPFERKLTAEQDSSFIEYPNPRQSGAEAHVLQSASRNDGFEIEGVCSGRRRKERANSARAFEFNLQCSVRVYFSITASAGTSVAFGSPSVPFT